MNITERGLKTHNIEPDSLRVRPPFPKRVKIEITRKCDLKCYFCQRTYHKENMGEIDRDFLYRILIELKSLGVEDVGLFWMGEPLLVQSLPEYVAFAKKIGIKYVFITTNGRLATPDRINKIIDSGLDSIKFSINGLKEKYLKLCGVDAFDQVISNLKNTWKYRGARKSLSIYASTIVDPANKGEYDDIHSLIAPYVDLHYRIILYGKSKLEVKNGQYHIVSTPEEEMKTLQSMLPCWALFTESHISYDGHMSACYCDLNERFYVGDLNSMSIMEAWHSEKYVALRKQHLCKDVTGAVCESCNAYR
jgi:MoaA/NifB/PqqE/SkfB family radical SAM enzyme